MGTNQLRREDVVEDEEVQAMKGEILKSDFPTDATGWGDKDAVWG